MNRVYRMEQERVRRSPSSMVPCCSSAPSPPAAAAPPPPLSSSPSHNSPPRTYPKPPPPPPIPQDDPVIDNCAPDNELQKKPAVVGNPDLLHDMLSFDSVAYLEKYKNYEIDCVRRLQAKYFSKSNIYGGSIFDEKVSVDDEIIKSSRWPCTRSYADPVKAFDDLNGHGVTLASEIPVDGSNGSAVLMKSS